MAAQRLWGESVALTAASKNARHGSPPLQSPEAVFRAHHAQIRRFLLRLTGDPAEAEDLAQQVFVDAAAAMSRAETQPRSVPAWLYAVAERRFADAVRRRSCERRIADLLAPTEAIEPDDRYGLGVADALRRAIARLPRDQRQVVVLKVFGGRSFAEIAARTGATPAACKMRHCRALREVRRFLEAEGLKP
ncbi:MAG: sigma-70 family RNA polymerase sigma factor [Actinomycetota bacterium]|nr:sigma-70 family RNA polymerase sigma factor [Actinomycetota bacterium]